MALTTSTNLVVPEVFGALIREKAIGKSIMLGLANVSDTLVGTAGDSVTFPKWNLLGDAQEMAEGDSINMEALTQSTQKVEIKQVGKGVTVLDRARLTSLGDPVEEAGVQIGDVIARKLDDDLITVAKTTPLTSPASGATTITANDLDDALNLFGDEQDADTFEGIVIHPKLKNSFLSMAEFVSTENATVEKGNGIVKRNILGTFRGIPVIMTTKGTYDSVTSKCQTLIIKKNALGLIYKREIFPEQQRDIEKKAWKLTADAMYAPALINDAGVILVQA